MPDIIRRVRPYRSLFACMFLQIVGGFRQFPDADQYRAPVLQVNVVLPGKQSGSFRLNGMNPA